jgi:hypothetical protein
MVKILKDLSRPPVGVMEGLTIEPMLVALPFASTAPAARAPDKPDAVRRYYLKSLWKYFEHDAKRNTKFLSEMILTSRQ